MQYTLTLTSHSLLPAIHIYAYFSFSSPRSTHLHLHLLLIPLFLQHTFTLTSPVQSERSRPFKDTQDKLDTKRIALLLHLVVFAIDSCTKYGIPFPCDSGGQCPGLGLSSTYRELRRSLHRIHSKRVHHFATNLRYGRFPIADGEMENYVIMPNLLQCIRSTPLSALGDVSFFQTAVRAQGNPFPTRYIQYQIQRLSAEFDLLSSS